MEKEQKEPREHVRFQRAIKMSCDFQILAQLFFIATIVAVVLVVWLAPPEYRLYAGFALGFVAFICFIVTMICGAVENYECKRYEKWWRDALLEMYTALDKATRNPCASDAEANIALFAWAKKLTEDYAPTASRKRPRS